MVFSKFEMNSSINKLFFSLIRVAVGTQESLSHVPSVREWEELYHIAQKQALIGICFAGMQRLSSIEDSIHHTPSGDFISPMDGHGCQDSATE